jgi:hypothetical protein
VIRARQEIPTPAGKLAARPRSAVRIALLGCLTMLLCAATAPALAAPATPSDPHGRILGVVPSHGFAHFSRTGSSNLSYHSGPVMRTNATYAIYWEPPGSSVSAKYNSLIDGFLGDVAADNGLMSNVYFSDTQYYDSSGQHIAYNSTFAGSFVDTSALPASGCTDKYTSACLTDAQLRSEISKDVGTNGWTPGPGSLFFIFTPKNVGSCYGSSCSFSYFCAYHSSYGSGASEVLYANQPYAAWVPAACGSGQSPNGDDADSTINVASHEHNESITDPLGTAWYDNRGQENGDKCAWTFGTPLGGINGSEFNQVINSHDYFLQREWSNHSSGCVLTST